MAGLRKNIFCELGNRIGALFLLIAVLPQFLWIALFIGTLSEGPALIADRFVASNGIVLRYRFRTTGRGAAVFHIIGRWLRAYGIDELPWLWNVVRGEIRLTDILRRAS